MSVYRLPSVCMCVCLSVYPCMCVQRKFVCLSVCACICVCCLTRCLYGTGGWAKWQASVRSVHSSLIRYVPPYKRQTTHHRVWRGQQWGGCLSQDQSRSVLQSSWDFPATTLVDILYSNAPNAHIHCIVTWSLSTAEYRVTLSAGRCTHHMCFPPYALQNLSEP